MTKFKVIKNELRNVKEPKCKAEIETFKCLWCGEETLTKHKSKINKDDYCVVCSHEVVTTQDYDKRR